MPDHKSIAESMFNHNTPPKIAEKQEHDEENIGTIFPDNQDNKTLTDIDPNQTKPEEEVADPKAPDPIKEASFEEEESGTVKKVSNYMTNYK
jgi:hypothetical protein